MHLYARRPEREAILPKASGPVFLGLSCSPSSRGPSPSPEPSPPSRLQPAEPRSLAASPRQRAPSICRKTPPFSVPLEHPQASASCPTPILSMKNRGQDRSGAEPNSKPVPRPGVTPTDSGTAATTQAQRYPDPAQCSAWPRGRRGRGKDGLTAGEGEGVGGEGGRVFIGVTFQKNSQRVAGVTPRGEKKFSYHVEREDSQSIFQMGSAFPVPV